MGFILEEGVVGGDDGDSEGLVQEAALTLELGTVACKCSLERKDLKGVSSCVDVRRRL